MILLSPGFYPIVHPAKPGTSNEYDPSVSAHPGRDFAILKDSSGAAGCSG